MDFKLYVKKITEPASVFVTASEINTLIRLHPAHFSKVCAAAFAAASDLYFVGTAFTSLAPNNDPKNLLLVALFTFVIESVAVKGLVHEVFFNIQQKNLRRSNIDSYIENMGGDTNNLSLKNITYLNKC